MFNAQYFRTFITLVETGSFTHTARRLDMTQPGVSQHIRKLEQYLDKPLLNRQGRRVRGRLGRGPARGARHDAVRERRGLRGRVEG